MIEPCKLGSRARRWQSAPWALVWALVALTAQAAVAAGDAPPAGGLEGLPRQRSVPVPLVNAGFENGTDGWRLAKAGPFAAADGAARTGKGCLRFDSAVPSRWTPSVRQAPKELKGGIYTLRFWVKVSNMKKPSRGTAGVRVALEYRRKGGARGAGKGNVLNGTFDWRQIELRVLVPDDVEPASGVLSIHRYNKPASGEACFDDFTLARDVPPPVEAYLRYPNYRGYLGADAPQRIRLWVRVNDVQARGAARVEVTGPAGGGKVASAAIAPGKREQVVELDAAGWPPGRYAVRARLGDYAYPPYTIQKISAEQRKALAVWFDEHNVLHVRGRKVFPLGFYNTTRKFDVVDDGEFARLDELADAAVNFNINYWWWPSATATRRKYLAEMHKRSIGYLDTVMPFKPAKAGYSPAKFRIVNELLPSAGGKLDTQARCDRFLTLLAERMRQFPGHTGWYVMDERPFGMVLSIFQQYTVLRRADPDHPTFGVSNRPAEFHKWRDALDVFGMDPYPLMNMKLGRPLSLVARETRAAAAATQDSRPVWMVLQFFQGWSTDRWPTAEELRSMSLMAVTEGARGLFYWSFGARALMSVKDPAKRRDYWRRAVKVTREIKSLEPALLAPNAPEAVSAVSDPRIRWRARQAGGKAYVFAYLPAEKFAERTDGEPVEVTFSLRNGRKVQRSFRPDTADWFAVPAKPE